MDFGRLEKNMRAKKSFGELLFDIVNITILIFISLTFIYPFIHVAVLSLSTPEAAAIGGFKLIPKQIVFNSYEKVLRSPNVWRGYMNTIIIVAGGWIVSMILTISGAYPLSRRNLPHRKFWTLFVVFTMFFQGGLIPSYLLVRNIGLSNSYFAMILPAALSTWNLLIMRNFFMAIPPDLEEAAYLDGASPFRALMSVILPVSKPVLATVSLWIIVSRWNSWFDCLIYITDPNKFVLQIVLRRIIFADTKEMLLSAEGNVKAMQDAYMTDPLTLRSATIMVATLPIIMIYPFIQKYFVKGVMVGSIKG
jgi:putative aldouronate transport system permease protein